MIMRAFLIPSGNRSGVLGLALVLFLPVIVFKLTGCASVSTSESLSPVQGSQIGQPEKDEKGIEEQWGIKIIDIRQTAAGHLLDFRYRVLDPEKAASLLDRDKEAHIIDQSSGIKLTVPSPPKIGSLRQSTKSIKPDRNYFILFSNPGGMVKPGMKVTVVIGDFRAENLIVQ